MFFSQFRQFPTVIFWLCHWDRDRTVDSQVKNVIHWSVAMELTINVCGVLGWWWLLTNLLLMSGARVDAARTRGWSHVRDAEPVQLNSGLPHHELLEVKEYENEQGFEATLKLVSNSHNSTYGADINPLRLTVRWVVVNHHYYSNNNNDDKKHWCFLHRRAMSVHPLLSCSHENGEVVRSMLSTQFVVSDDY